MKGYTYSNKKRKKEVEKNNFLMRAFIYSASNLILIYLASVKFSQEFYILSVQAKCVFCRIKQYPNNMLFCKIKIIRNKKMADQTPYININARIYQWTVYQVLKQQQYLKKQKDIPENKRHTICLLQASIGEGPYPDPTGEHTEPRPTPIPPRTPSWNSCQPSYARSSANVA